MAADSTAIAIVSITAGSVVALGGTALAARFSARQDQRRFAHEREMADLLELRRFLDHALEAVQDVVEAILDVHAELEAVTDSGDGEIREDQLVQHAREARESTSRLRSPLVGLIMRLGGAHPLVGDFRRLLDQTLAAARAIPDEYPVTRAALDRFGAAWFEMTDVQRTLLENITTWVGVALPDRLADAAATPTTLDAPPLAGD